VSIEFDVAPADNFRPLAVFLLQKCAELGWRRTDGLRTKVIEALLHLVLLQYIDQDCMKLGGDGLWRAGRQQHAVPLIGFVAGNRCFGNGGYIGQTL
jgi:hypothetical protein